jgi:hypothetical protein
LFYLESPDFGRYLEDWNQSEVRSEWMAGDNHEDFLTTRLVLKLQDVFDEFGAAAGFSPDLDALETVAGEESAISFYDLRELHFLYVSRLPAARLAGNVLTGATGYQARQSGGQQYLRRSEGDRTSAFAVVGDHVVVATREDLLVAALGLIAADSSDTSVLEEPWYQDGLGALPPAAGPIAFRLIMDLPRVIATPYFRSYWIQQNTSAWSEYSAFAAEITQGQTAFEESRAFVRADEAEAVSDDEAIRELGRFVPDTAGLTRLWNAATPSFAVDLVSEKLFAERPRSSAMPASVAPGAASRFVAGSPADLAISIDEAPAPPIEGGLDLSALSRMFEAADIRAVLHLEATAGDNAELAGQVYVSRDVALAFRAGSDWDGSLVRDALTQAVRPYQTVGELGLGWNVLPVGNRSAWQIDGLLPITMMADGPTLWIARTPSLLEAATEAVAGSFSSSGASPASYLARYRHDRELGAFLETTRMLDAPDPPRSLSFFSDNVGSLASALDVVREITVRVEDDGRVRTEAVAYTVVP